MTSAKQALHVLRKDILHLRWYVGAYALLCAIAVVRVAGVTLLSASLTANVLALLAALIIAMAIQDDSPMSDDAAWRVRPLSPSAMLSAKLLFATLLLAIALFGQLLCLWILRADASQAQTALSDGVRVLLYWIGAAAVAAITTNVRQFIVAACGLMLLAVITLFVAFSSANSSNDAMEPLLTWRGWTAIAAGIATLVVAALYVRGITRWMARIGVVAGAVLAASPMLLATGVASPTRRTETSPTQDGPVRAVTLDYAMDVSVDSAVLAIAPAISTTPSTSRLSAVSGTATLRFPDGHQRVIDLARAQIGTERRSLEGNRVEASGGGFSLSLVVAEPTRLDSAGLEWPRESTTRSLFSVGAVDSAERVAIERGVVSVVVTGVGTVLELRVGLSLPVRRQAAVVSHGMRVAHRATTTTPTRGEWHTLHVERLGSSLTPLQPTFSDGVMSFTTMVLLNRHLGIVTTMDDNFSYPQRGPLVLPGGTLEQRTYSERDLTSRPGRALQAIDSLGTTELALVQWDFRGRVRFTAPSAMAKVERLGLASSPARSARLLELRSVR